MLCIKAILLVSSIGCLVCAKHISLNKPSLCNIFPFNKPHITSNIPISTISPISSTPVPQQVSSIIEIDHSTPEVATIPDHISFPPVVPQHDIIYPYQQEIQQPQQGVHYTPQVLVQYPPQQGTQYPPQQGSQYPPQQGSQYPPQQGYQYPPQPEIQYQSQQGTLYQSLPEIQYQQQQQEVQNQSPQEVLYQQEQVQPPQQEQVQPLQQEQVQPPQQEQVQPPQQELPYKPEQQVTIQQLQQELKPLQQNLEYELQKYQLQHGLKFPPQYLQRYPYHYGPVENFYYQQQIEPTKKSVGTFNNKHLPKLFYQNPLFYPYIPKPYSQYVYSVPYFYLPPTSTVPQVPPQPNTKST